MKRFWLITQVLALLAPPWAYAQANGYIGLFSDPEGTQPCTNVPPFTAAALYVVAVTEGASRAGITGAEFRIEVSNPSGWLIAYSAPASATAVMGNPIDTNPDPNAGGGTRIAFPECQVPVAAKVSLGTIAVYNRSGTATDLVVLRHSTPSISNSECPLLIACDAPVFSKFCVDLPATAPACSLAASRAFVSSGRSFAATLNPEPLPEPPSEPFEGTLTRGDADLWVAGTRVVDNTFQYSFDGIEVTIAGIPAHLMQGAPPNSEEELTRIYGQVPFIVARLSEGLTLRESRELFWAEVGANARLVEWAYRNSNFAAVAGLLRASPLVEDVVVDSQNHTVKVKYLGLDVPMGVAPASPGIQHFTRAEAAHTLLASLRSELKRPGPRLIFVTPSAISVFTGTDMLAAQKQLEYLSRGGDLNFLPAGPLRSTDPTVRGIAAHRKHVKP
jgi:hypothetical protein